MYCLLSIAYCLPFDSLLLLPWIASLFRAPVYDAGHDNFALAAPNFRWPADPRATASFWTSGPGHSPCRNLAALSMWESVCMHIYRQPSQLYSNYVARAI